MLSGLSLIFCMQIISSILFSYFSHRFWSFQNFLEGQTDCTILDLALDFHVVDLNLIPNTDMVLQSHPEWTLRTGECVPHTQKKSVCTSFHYQKCQLSILFIQHGIRHGNTNEYLIRLVLQKL